MAKCIICLKGGANLHHGPSTYSLIKLQECAEKRTAYGEIKYAPLCQRIHSMPGSEYQSAKQCYHYSCYKELTNSEKLQRASKRYAAAISTAETITVTKKGRSEVPPKRGRPSTSTSTVNEAAETRNSRPRRSREMARSRTCIFQCTMTKPSQLHRIETESMGHQMLFFKENSPDENVRIALADIQNPLDCSAYDIVYHRDCYLAHKRSTSAYNRDKDTHSNEQYVLADIDILNAVRCSLTLGKIVTMRDINEDYIDLLKEAGVSPMLSDYKKHLKNIIRAHISDVKFVKPHRLNESEHIISTNSLGTTVSEARACQMSNEETAQCLANAARIVRQEVTRIDKWKFTGSMTDYDPPPRLKSFMKWLLLGNKNNIIRGQKSTESKKLVNIVSQHVINNTKTDRQVGYETKQETGFRNRNQTPLSIGLGLTIHKKTRSKNIVNTLSQLQIGAGYQEIVNIEKKLSTAVQDRMQETGGYCLPPFVKKDQPLYFAADNIDFLEQTPDGQNTLHGTILVINQQDDDTKLPVNEPLILPETVKPLKLDVDYKKVSGVQGKPITFENFELDAYSHVVKKYEAYDLAWFMAFHSTSASTINEPNKNYAHTQSEITSEVENQNDTEIGFGSSIDSDNGCHTHIDIGNKYITDIEQCSMDAAIPCTTDTELEVSISGEDIVTEIRDTSCHIIQVNTDGNQTVSGIEIDVERLNTVRIPDGNTDNEMKEHTHVTVTGTLIGESPAHNQQSSRTEQANDKFSQQKGDSNDGDEHMDKCSETENYKMVDMTNRKNDNYVSSGSANGNNNGIENEEYTVTELELEGNTDVSTGIGTDYTTKLVPESSPQPVQTDSETSKVRKKAITPTWAATNSLLIESGMQHTSEKKTNSGIIAPLFRKPPTDYATLYTVLCMAQGISAVVVGPDRRTVITLDLDLYERALKLQSSTGNNNWVLRLGELHACFASLHAIAKYIEGSGLDAISIEAGIYSPATVRQIYTGKWYKRGIEYHITHVLACYKLLFESTIDDQQMALLSDRCRMLASKLHNKDADAPAIFDEICNFFDEDFHRTVRANSGEMATFLLNYMQQVESLMRFIRGSRQGNWLLHLAALEEQVKYYFAHDLYKYARLVPVYLAQMSELEVNDPETWTALQNGDFVVRKSGIPFTDMFVDQTLEQKIRELKVLGGITGITQDEDALNRFFLIAPELTRIVNSFQDEYGIHHEQSQSGKQHYQLSSSMALRIQENASKINACITEHCEGNPFEKSTELVNMVSSMVVSEESKNDILKRDEKGRDIFEKFVSERLVSESADKSIWDPVKKAKLKTFATCQKKSKCKVGEKLVKLREDRQLLARFLVVQQSRPTLLSSLGDTIAKYEFSSIPRSLFSSDGLLLIPTDKSAFIHAIESYHEERTDSMDADSEVVETQTDDPFPGENVAQDMGVSHTDPEVTKTNDHVCIIDGMAIVQSIKKGPNMQTCSDFAAAFVQSVTRKLKPYAEGRVIFDRYIDGSLKAQTRVKRAGGENPVKFLINDMTNIKMVQLKTLLSHIETKAQLTEYLGKSLLKAFANSDKKMVVAYGTATYSNKPDVFHPDIDVHSHEEADTLIPLHVLDVAMQEGRNPTIDVISPDTDVLVLLMDMYSRTSVTCQVNFITGKDSRVIDVRERCVVVGKEKSQGLLGLHNFTGADWGGKFVGISKKRWVTKYLTLPASSNIVTAFGTLGDELLDIPHTLETLEPFICVTYSKTTKCRKVADLRWELFRSKNLEAEKLPPTTGALTPHVKRANYITIVGRGYVTAKPTIPSILDHGWELATDGDTVPTKNLLLPAPDAVLELVKCGCRGQCSHNCSCIKNTLPCTALCKCSDCENTVDYTISDERDIRDD